MPAIAAVKTNEVEDFVRELDAAIGKAANQIQGAELKISEVAVDINTTLEKGVGVGEVDLKIVKFGAKVSKEKVRTVTVTFAPAPPKPAFLSDHIDEELIKSLEVIQAAVSGIGKQFTLSSAAVEIGLKKTIEGKLQIILGGEGSKADTHTAKLKFEPATKN
jgi:hypothetical protein